jgi:cytochrome c-type biogenesis protein CcmH/NrfF
LINITPDLSINATLTEEILNWGLPILGVIFAGLIIWFIWRYVRKSNPAGRISEFDEKALKKLIEDKGSQKHLPFCADCKMPMRVEIRYKDFMKDQGDFLISRETAELTMASLVGSSRISQADMDLMDEYFTSHPELEQQLFKRYKCPNCSKIHVLPYLKLTD